MSDVHRDNPEASEEEIEAKQIASLLRAPQGPRREPQAPRTCRNCERVYQVAASQANNHSKWWSLCANCLSYEL